MKHLVWTLLGILVLPHVAASQTPSGPRWTIAISLGEGPHTDHANDVYYRSSSSNSGQISASYRFGAGAVRPMLRAELVTEGPGSDHAGCPLAPNGSCRRVFPGPDGIGAATGIVFQLRNRIEASLLVAIGRYDSTTRRVLEAEGAFGITGRVAATLAIRRMTWTEPGLGRHWYRPVHVGLRAQWN